LLDGQRGSGKENLKCLGLGFVAVPKDVLEDVGIWISSLGKFLSLCYVHAIVEQGLLYGGWSAESEPESEREGNVWEAGVKKEFYT